MWELFGSGSCSTLICSWPSRLVVIISPFGPYWSIGHLQELSRHPNPGPTSQVVPRYNPSSLFQPPDGGARCFWGGLASGESEQLTYRLMFVVQCLLVGCLISQQHAMQQHHSVSQGQSTTFYMLPHWQDCRSNSSSCSFWPPGQSVLALTLLIL